LTGLADIIYYTIPYSYKCEVAAAPTMNDKKTIIYVRFETWKPALEPLKQASANKPYYGLFLFRSLCS